MLFPTTLIRLATFNPTQPHLRLKMQTSITMFFKAKPPPKTEQPEAQPQPATRSHSESDTEIEPKPEQTSLNKKRPAEDNEESIHIHSDQSDSDNEISFRRKKLAVPTIVESDSDTEPVNPIVEDKKPLTPTTTKHDNKTAPSTPTCQPNMTLKIRTTPCTPMFDTSLIIKRKISAGAFALHENIGASWFRALQAEFDKPYFKQLSSFIQQERSTKTVYPPEDMVYTWTRHHDIQNTRVVILGQDPYHGPNQAHGLSFSVTKGVRIPPSLINIYKELESDIPGFSSPNCGDLTGWAKQGVLLLNTCLTVNQGQANSHQNKGWENFTDAVITWLSKNSRNKLVFLLWGRPAQKKSSMVDKRHLLLTSAHPSPLSAHNGFFGCAHFSKANKFLQEQKLPEIDWKAL